jgi:hypothetical protein
VTGETLEIRADLTPGDATRTGLYVPVGNGQ